MIESVYHKNMFGIENITYICIYNACAVIMTILNVFHMICYFSDIKTLIHISVSGTNGYNKLPGMAQFSVDSKLSNWENAEDAIFTVT